MARVQSRTLSPIPREICTSANRKPLPTSESGFTEKEISLILVLKSRFLSPMNFRNFLPLIFNVSLTPVAIFLAAASSGLETNLESR